MRAIARAAERPKLPPKPPHGAASVWPSIAIGRPDLARIGASRATIRRASGRITASPLSKNTAPCASTSSISRPCDVTVTCTSLPSPATSLAWATSDLTFCAVALRARCSWS